MGKKIPSWVNKASENGSGLGRPQYWLEERKNRGKQSLKGQTSGSQETRQNTRGSNGDLSTLRSPVVLFRKPTGRPRVIIPSPQSRAKHMAKVRRVPGYIAAIRLLVSWRMTPHMPWLLPRAKRTAERIDRQNRISWKLTVLADRKRRHKHPFN